LGNGVTLEMAWPFFMYVLFNNSKVIAKYISHVLSPIIHVASSIRVGGLYFKKTLKFDYDGVFYVKLDGH